MSKVSEILNRAADLMQQHGHAKMRFVVTDQYDADKGCGPVGSMCLQGALQAAVGVPRMDVGYIGFIKERALYDTAMTSLAQTILDMKGLPEVMIGRGSNNISHVVATWNNLVATQDQAIAALRTAAKRENA